MAKGILKHLEKMIRDQGNDPLASRLKATQEDIEYLNEMSTKYDISASFSEEDVVSALDEAARTAMKVSSDFSEYKMMKELITPTGKPMKP